LKAKVNRMKRAAHERPEDNHATALAGRDSEIGPNLRALLDQPLLDQELNRLPEKFRAPLVLCYMQGKTYEEAAQQLRCPKRTLSPGLTRAREQLRRQLTERGLALSAGMVATALAHEAAGAAVPAALMNSTFKAAMGFAAGNAAMAGGSASVAALTEGVLKAMFLTKLKVTVAILLVVGVIGLAGGMYQGLARAAAARCRLVATGTP